MYSEVKVRNKKEAHIAVLLECTCLNTRNEKCLLAENRKKDSRFGVYSGNENGHRHGDNDGRESN